MLRKDRKKEARNQKEEEEESSRFKKRVDEISKIFRSHERSLEIIRK